MHTRHSQVNIIDRNEYLTKTKTFLENIPRVVHPYRHDDPRSLLQPIRSEGCDQDVLASHQRKSEWGGESVNQQMTTILHPTHDLGTVRTLKPTQKKNDTLFSQIPPNASVYVVLLGEHLTRYRKL